MPFIVASKKERLEKKDVPSEAKNIIRKEVGGIKALLVLFNFLCFFCIVVVFLSVTSGHV